MVPITVILMNTESLLIAIKQDPAISVIASKFCIMMIPGIWAMTMYDATRKFLSAQFETTVPLFVATITLTIHFFLSWLLVGRLGMREVGCAIATNVTYVLNFTLLEWWVARSETMKMTYSYPDKRSFQNLGFYLKIGVPGALLTCYEWWAFEILTIFAGMISITALGAHIIIY